MFLNGHAKCTHMTQFFLANKTFVLKNSWFHAKKMLFLKKMVVCKDVISKCFWPNS